MGRDYLRRTRLGGDEFMTYKIPTDYKAIFKDRIIVITGVGRSGTTQLGRILGSMTPTHYIFEPAILKLLPMLTLGGVCLPNGITMRLREIVRATFFEDYCLPLISGHHVNMNPKDWTYIFDYVTAEDMEAQWKLSRRQDAIEYINNVRPYWIIKSPEALSVMPALNSIFGKVCYIHIIRNGLDVVASAIKRGWYSDEYMGNRDRDGRIVEWVKEGTDCNIPWYLKTNNNGLNLFDGLYTQATRAAYAWRYMTQVGIIYGKMNPERYIEIRYEDMCRAPAEVSTLLAERFNLKWTVLTELHIANTAKTKLTSHDLKVEDIQEPEYSKFIVFMKKLGYL